MGTDDGAAKTIERVWVDRFDHSVEPPRFVGRTFLENGQVVRETGADDEEAKRDAEAGRIAAERAATKATGLQEDDGDEVSGERAEIANAIAPKLDPWETIAIVARAAQECGIETERAFRFIATISVEIRAKSSGAVAQPLGRS